ncbi:MAG: hypothetical protein MJ110_07225, partial [Lachnospiraceae bacterium]|nr:hypothetical protein [Lachnospiraceae bacterium]
LRQKGALFVEYALIFALIAIVGTVFLSDNGISKSVTGIFSSASDTLDKAGSAKQEARYGRGEGLRISWLESDKVREQLAKADSTYPTLESSNTYESDAKYAFLDSIAKELGVNSNQVTYTYANNASGGILMYSLHEEGPINVSESKPIQTTIVRYNPDGSVNKIESDIATYQGFKKVQKDNCPTHLENNAGFWNQDKKEIMYQQQK